MMLAGVGKDLKGSGSPGVGLRRLGLLLVSDQGV